MVFLGRTEKRGKVYRIMLYCSCLIVHNETVKNVLGDENGALVVIEEQNYKVDHYLTTIFSEMGKNL